jgi:hypothetical protein
MPTDASVAEYHAPPVPTGTEPENDRTLPAGAGLAFGVLVGAAIWGGILSLFLLF